MLTISRTWIGRLICRGCTILGESVLFATATFKGTPLIAHRELTRHAPLTSVAFDRWSALFQSTVDDLFSGPMAEHAKSSAARIAATMEHRIGSSLSSIHVLSLRQHEGPGRGEPELCRMESMGMKEDIR
jgi:hypothetical protein